MNERTKLPLLVFLMIVSLKPAAVFGAYCEVGEPYAYVAPFDLEECPGDIQAWMDRTNGCEHLKHQVAKSEEAIEAQEDARYDLECVFIACDYQDMIVKYKGNGVLTKIIKTYKTLVFGEDAQLACDLDR